jgi:hypothetical protein
MAPARARGWRPSPVSSGGRRRGLAAGLIGLAALCAGAQVGLAQEEAPRRAPTLLLHVAAEDAAVPAIDERLRARLGALGVTLSLLAEPTVDVTAALDESAGARPDCARAPLAEAWLDGLVPGWATLVVVPCTVDRALARRLAAPNGFDEVLLAELEYIVDRATQALLAAQPVGGTREEARAALEVAPPPPMPEPPPAVVTRPRAAPRPPPTALAPQLGFSAGVQGWSSDDPALPVAGLFGGLEQLAGRARIGLVLAIGARSVARVATTEAQLSLWGGDAHLWLTLARRFEGAGLWRLSAGPGLDLTHVTSSRTDGAPLTAKVASRTDVDVTIGGQLRWDVVPLGRAIVFAAAGIDVLTRAARYTAVVDGASRTLVQPWGVRPSLVLGVAFDPGDQPPSAQRR